METQIVSTPDGRIRIPLNQSLHTHSPIAGFLNANGGAGVRHVAFETSDIHATVEALHARGVRFQRPPNAYYDLLSCRVGAHEEDMERLKANHVLIDGDARRDGILLQAFTDDAFGPVFFEIIQRKGHQGFGGGNAQALLEAAGLEQMRQGLLRV